jgi:hypothetical protein
VPRKADIKRYTSRRISENTSTCTTTTSLRLPGLLSMLRRNTPVFKPLGARARCVSKKAGRAFSGSLPARQLLPHRRVSRLLSVACAHLCNVLNKFELVPSKPPTCMAYANHHATLIIHHTHVQKVCTTSMWSRGILSITSRAQGQLHSVLNQPSSNTATNFTAQARDARETNFLRHVKGRLQMTQVLLGKLAFRTPRGMSTTTVRSSARQLSASTTDYMVSPKRTAVTARSKVGQRLRSSAECNPVRRIASTSSSTRCQVSGDSDQRQRRCACQAATADACTERTTFER